jgi:hypothetical protein
VNEAQSRWLDTTLEWCADVTFNIIRGTDIDAQSEGLCHLCPFICPYNAKKRAISLPVSVVQRQKVRCWSLLMLLNSLTVGSSTAGKSVAYRRSLKIDDSEGIEAGQEAQLSR